MPDPLEQLRTLLGDRFQAIAGASITADIPVANDLIDRFIAEALAGSNAPVAAVHFEAQDADQLLVHVSPRAPLPTLRIAAHIEQQPRPEAPVLGLRWSLPGLGPLAFFASPVLAYFKALPPGIRVDGDRLSIDIPTLARARGFGDLLPLLRSLRVNTRGGRLVVAVEVRV